MPKRRHKRIEQRAAILAARGAGFHWNPPPFSRCMRRQRWSARLKRFLKDP